MDTWRMTMPVHITLGGYQGTSSVHTYGLQMFRDTLHRLVGPRVNVTLRTNMGADGHRTADLPKLAEDGEIDGCYISSSYLAERIPALSLFDMPFAAPDHQDMLSLLDGDLGTRLAQEVQALTGLSLMGIWDNGLRHIATADRVMTDPAQSAGLVLRTLPSDNHQYVFRQLGFDPRVVDAKDLPQAVADGIVTAQENPLTNTYQFGLHKALPTITLTGHLMGIALFVLNRDRLDMMPADIRNAVVQAARDATRAQRMRAVQEDKSAAQALIDAGARLIALTPPELAAWRSAARPALEKCRARLTPELLSFFEPDISTAEGMPS
jgi:C4-dicarboxylate-binding protein DctP